uniref:Uncharacterized protein n=1 Tax=Solanum tuberosum TaxID=4113 RepID=M1DG73_SOLTU
MIYGQDETFMSPFTKGKRTRCSQKKKRMRPSWPSSQRGRGRDADGGRGGHFLSQLGNKQLVAKNIATTSGSGLNTDHPMNKEFMTLCNPNSSDPKGKGKIAQPNIQPPQEIENFKLKDFSDLENFMEKTFKGNNLKPLKVNGLSGEESSRNMEFFY